MKNSRYNFFKLFIISHFQTLLFLSCLVSGGLVFHTWHLLYYFVLLAVESFTGFTALITHALPTLEINCNVNTTTYHLVYTNCVTLLLKYISTYFQCKYIFYITKRALKVFNPTSVPLLVLVHIVLLNSS